MQRLGQKNSHALPTLAAIRSIHFDDRVRASAEMIFGVPAVRKIVVGLLSVSVLSGFCFAASSKASDADAQPVHVYHSMIPLGSEVFSYSNKTERQVFYVMASAQGREFEGQQVWADGGKQVLKTSTGDLVAEYPRQVSFRVSVSERSDFVTSSDTPLQVESHGRTFNQLISGLNFEMKVFHDLTSRVLRPTTVRHIGIPPELPAGDRIYEVTFELGEVPISDRLVMQVLTDGGERLAKFNIDLY